MGHFPEVARGRTRREGRDGAARHRSARAVSDSRRPCTADGSSCKSAAPSPTIVATRDDSDNAHGGSSHGQRAAHGTRFHGRAAGTRGRVLRRPDDEGRAQLPDQRPPVTAVLHPRSRPDQAGRRRGQSRPRAAGPRSRRRDRPGRTGGRGRQAERPVRGRRLPDRLGHVDQHERQRGDLEPGHRDARGRAGLAGPGPSQRPRQRGPVVERRDPDGHPRRGAERPVRRADPGAGAPSRRAGAQGGGVHADRQDRPGRTCRTRRPSGSARSSRATRARWNGASGG